MGNSLNHRAFSPYDKNLITQLRQCTLSDLQECVRVISEDYPDSTGINLQNFEDIFGCMVDEAEPFFLLLQNGKDIKGVVDIYESLALFAVFARERFENKAAFIFQLFDFDQNGSLDTRELSLTLQSVARSLCKSIHIFPPSRVSLDKESQSIFDTIDRDKNERITFDEFMLWINSDRELQDFLLKYAGTQTFQNLTNIFNTIYIKYLDFFNIASGSHESEYVREEELRSLIEKEESSLNRVEEVNFLFEILKNTTTATSLTDFEHLISREAYRDIIKAWCAFNASDLNGDDFLVDHELNALLWLYEEKEPSKDRVAYEMTEMGKDNTTGITMLDWLKNLCIAKNGKYILRPNLKKLFEKYDVDGSGYLSLDELKQLVRDPFRDYLASAAAAQSVLAMGGFGNSKADCLEGIVESLTKELFTELDSNKNTNLSWEEFKAFMEIAPKKFDKIKQFLRLSL